MNEEDRPGMQYVPGVGWRKIMRLALMTYYYGVTIPASPGHPEPTGRTGEYYINNVGVANSDTTISLFTENIGNKEYTNLQRPEQLPPGHEALIYRVGLGAKAGSETKLMELYTMLQFGHLTLESSTEFLSEELCNFPLCVYGDIASRYPDPAVALAMTKYFDTDDEDLLKKVAPYMKRLSGMLLPVHIPSSDVLKGTLTFRPGMSIDNSFMLFVILYSLTSIPMEVKKDSSEVAEL